MVIIGYKNVQHYRHTVHRYLDGIWTLSTNKKQARRSMYKLLSNLMNLTEDETHVRFFTKNQCKQAIKILKPMYIELRGKDLDYNFKEKKGREKMPKVQVTRIKRFEAAHLLPEYNGGCGNVHGHSYCIQVTVEGPQTEPYGMVMDFKDLDKAINAVMPDHRFLHQSGNEISEAIVEVLNKYGLKYVTFSEATSAENMVSIYAKEINDYIHNELNKPDIEVVKVVLYETENSYATWLKD